MESNVCVISSTQIQTRMEMLRGCSERVESASDAEGRTQKTTWKRRKGKVYMHDAGTEGKRNLAVTVHIEVGPIGIHCRGSQ